MKIRIVLVEDHQKTRLLLKDIIEESSEILLIKAFPDAESAIKEMANYSPDVVLMDINLPGSSGISCVAQLKLKLPDTQFIMYTVYEDTDQIFEALSAGATGYILKDSTKDEVLIAIKDVYSGGSPMSGSIARKVVQSFMQAIPPPNRHSQKNLDSFGISPRQKEILELLVSGYLYKEIAEQLKLSRGSVNTYVRRIYEKLHVHSRAQAMIKYHNNSGPT